MTGTGTTIRLDYAPPAATRSTRILAWTARHRRRLILLTIILVLLAVTWLSGITWQRWTVDDYSNFTAIRNDRISIGSFGYTWSRYAPFRFSNLAGPGDRPMFCTTYSPFDRNPDREIHKMSWGRHHTGQRIVCASGLRPLGQPANRQAFEFVAALAPEFQDHETVRAVFDAIDADRQLPFANRDVANQAVLGVHPHFALEICTSDLQVYGTFLQKKFPYANGQTAYAKVGNTLSFFFDTGKVKAVGTHINGVLEGEWTFYRETGQVWCVANFRNNEKHGPWIRYDENDQVEYEAAFADGKPVSGTPNRPVEASQR